MAARQTTVEFPGLGATGADRVLLVLRRLAEHPRGVGLDELARELEAPKTSVHRALQSLCRAGFADQDARRGRYRLSLDLVRLVFSYYDSWDTHAEIRPALEAVAHLTGETAHFATLDGSEVVYVAKVTPAGQGVQMSSRIGGRNPAHCTGVGKALLAHELLDRAATDRYVAEYGPLVRRTPNTLTSAARLHRELTRVRRDGYAVDREESELGICCIAFPVALAAPSRPAGAVSVSALAHRKPVEELVGAAGELADLIRRLAPMLPQP